MIALYGATVGKLGILNRDAASNQAVCAIFPPVEVNTKYLFWYLRYARSDLIAQAIGGAQPNISQGILRNLKVPLAPFEQQKLIVAEIEKQFSRLDEAVANLKRVKANLKRYKAAVLKAAVEGKLTEEWRKQHPDVEPARKLLERIKAERRKKWEEAELAKMKAKGKVPKDDKWKKKYKESFQLEITQPNELPTGWTWGSWGQISNWVTYGFTRPMKVLTNPPFGKKSSTTVMAADGKVVKEKETYERDDFWATTSNKQLNFLQHVKTILKQHGRCGIVVPDNVLFEGGAGETIRRKLLHECDVHTLLRLPTGLFYAQGVKANILFFDLKPASETPWTKKLWIYDLRTNMHFTLKTKPLRRSDLDEFVEFYKGENLPASQNSAQASCHNRKSTCSEGDPNGGRWRAYDYEELINRDKASLDIFWLREPS